MRESTPFFLAMSLASSVLWWITTFSGWFNPPPSFATPIIFILAATTWLIYFYLLQWHKKRPALFTQFYLASLGLKLLAYGALVSIIVIFDKEGAVGNAVIFLVCYTIFTFVEVLFLFRKISR